MIAHSLRVEGAVVFLHGFMGHPLKTWHQFPRMIRNDSRWRKTDVYFLGYDSVGDSLKTSAFYVAHFLTSISKEGRKAVEQKLVYPDEKPWDEVDNYQTIRLIAHSAGGVVLRLAVLLLVNKEIRAGALDGGSGQNPTPIPNYDPLLLFAPALGGARLAGWIGQAANLFAVKQLMAIKLGRSPSYKELQPGSQVLDEVGTRTIALAQAYPQTSALRAWILWAQSDDIVASVAFDRDTESLLLKADHGTVCKPSPSFDAPFTFATVGEIDDPMVAL